MNLVNSQAHLQEKILTEQIKLVYKPLLTVFVANSLCALVVVMALWHLISHTTLSVWFGAMMLATFIRVSAYMSFRRNFSLETIKRYERYYIIEAGLHGLLWGIAGVLLFPYGDLTYQLFLIVMLIGVGAAAPVTKSAYMPGFYAFFPIAVLPISILLLSIGDFLHIALGLSGIAFFIIVTHFAIVSNRHLKETLFLRFENIELVEQLRKQKDEAEKANLAKSNFLAAASHDLRQPLHALTLFASVLDESIQEPRMRKVVEQINTSLRALESLFNALLDISRLDAGVLKVEKSIFMLQPMFSRLKGEFIPQANTKGLHMNWPKSEHSALTDPTLLEQILRNYLSNAIRYTSTGEVNVDCESDGNRVTINVRDTGVGIPDDRKDIIFEEFRQLGNPERDRTKGLGLGLAIVKRTAKLLGHEFGVESLPGKGTRFYITVEQARITEATIQQPPNAEKDTININGTLIVVIDDEKSVRDGMQSLLNLWGCNVITAANKKEALERLMRHQQIPDGIIADYRLRDNQTGIDAIRSIHAEYDSYIPALIITGDIAVDRLRVANDSGYQVLHKPVAPIKLRSFLRNIQINK